MVTGQTEAKRSSAGRALFLRVRGGVLAGTAGRCEPHLCAQWMRSMVMFFLSEFLDASAGVAKAGGIAIFCIRAVMAPIVDLRVPC